MARSSLITSLALLAGLAFSGSARADDLSPPPWRFNAGTTVQHWDFSAGAGGGAPDALPLNNPYGAPMLSPSAGTVWMPTLVGRNDVWAIAGSSLNFDIPNTGIATHQKELWLQVTFLANAAVPFPGYTVGSTTGLFSQIGGPISTPLGGGWVHQLTKWSALVCPPSERVSIFPAAPGAAVYIDQVVIDTECFPVPTPSTASLLAIGGLMVAKRRRRA